MSDGINWIKSELRRRYRRADLSKGVDLNRNGTLEPNERISTFNNNKIPGNDTRVIGDWADWLAFYQKNRARLKKLSSLFRLSSRFPKNSYIHTITMIESAEATRRKIKTTYRRLLRVRSKLRRYRRYMTLGPSEKLEAVYDAIKDARLKIRMVRSPLFVDNVSKRRLDCDSSSFIALIIGQERGWPLHPVYVPGHIFVRWDNGLRGKQRERINVDQGHFLDDNEYREDFEFSTHSVTNRVYLNNLDRRGLTAIVLHNRGTVRLMKKKYKAAYADYDKALNLKTNFIASLIGRSGAAAYLGKYGTAKSDLEKALKYDKKHKFLGSALRLIRSLAAWSAMIKSSKNSELYAARAIEAFEHGLASNGFRDIETALKLNKKDAFALAVRGYMRCASKKCTAGLKDVEAAYALQPSSVATLLYLGKALLKAGKYKRAIRMFSQVLAHDAQSAPAIIGIAIAHGRLGSHKLAAQMFNKMIKRNPKDVDARLARGRYYESRKDYGKALTDYSVAVLNDDKNPEAHYRIGMVFYKQEKYEYAILRFEDAFQYAPFDEKPGRMYKLAVKKFKKQKKPYKFRL